MIIYTSLMLINVKFNRFNELFKDVSLQLLSDSFKGSMHIHRFNELSKCIIYLLRCNWRGCTLFSDSFEVCMPCPALVSTLLPPQVIPDPVQDRGEPGVHPRGVLQRAPQPPAHHPDQTGQDGLQCTPVQWRVSPVLASGVRRRHQGAPTVALTRILSRSRML